MDSFIVSFWSRVFSFLQWISIFQLLKYLFPKLRTSRFVEHWVLGNLVLSFTSVFIVWYISLPQLKILIGVYGFLRVFEIIITQINILLFDEYRAKVNKKKYSIRSYRRTVILLLHNFFEIVLWFAVQYVCLRNDIALLENKQSLFAIVYSSFIVTTNFGPFNVKPLTIFGMVVIWGQSVVGLFMTLLSLARFVSLLPKPVSNDEHEI